MFDHGLRERIKPGRPLTLVLGAGVSSSRGIPLWTDLLETAWKSVFGKDPFAADKSLLHRAKIACSDLPKEFVDRLGIRRHPFELQFAFEQIFDHLRWFTTQPSRRRRAKGHPPTARRPTIAMSNEQRAARDFTNLLRKALYRGQLYPARTATTRPDTLALIALAVRRAATTQENQRLISSVITFNVDDLLECEVNAGCRRRIPYALPISRPSEMRPLPSRQTIAIHHLHGFVPRNGSRYPYLTETGRIDDVKPPDSLVFTDEQYWRTVGNPTGFASRVFADALSGTCVFIGLSMTDINIIRWLAQDAIERGDDFRRLAAGWTDPTEVEYNVMEELLRHYWITTGTGKDMRRRANEDVVANTLVRRGVARIEIPSWDSKEFRAWWIRRFVTPSSR